VQLMEPPAFYARGAQCLRALSVANWDAVAHSSAPRDAQDRLADHLPPAENRAPDPLDDRSERENASCADAGSQIRLLRGVRLSERLATEKTRALAMSRGSCQRVHGRE
jgi:hypothetical protein